MNEDTSNKFKKNILKNMVYIRIVEEKIVELYSEQEMRCPVHLSIGQESSASIICQLLDKSDHVYSNHRSHAHYLAKGGDLKSFLLELYGRVGGCSGGRGGSMHLIDVEAGFMGSTAIVGGTIPLAVGDSFNSKLITEQSQNPKRVIVVFIGDGATEEGVFYESLNFAKLHNLPILFVCEDNDYAVYTPKSKRRSFDILNIPNSFDIFSLTTNGYDIDDLIEKSKDVINYLKKGNGPAFLKINTYRWREHCGPNYDNDLGYRCIKEFEEWTNNDFLAKLENELIQKNIISKDEIDEYRSSLNDELNQIIVDVKKSEFPSKVSITKNLFSE
jgi:TPP-dependent pyruvate/acetoin dehydrogenase alpha subunit